MKKSFWVYIVLSGEPVLVNAVYDGNEANARRIADQTFRNFMFSRNVYIEDFFGNKVYSLER